ncbi:class I SAM-dependent methyltransferase [Selenomonas sp. TAMA-11512]|uniref:class I SAM-dependent methyltransferase n=1 Tax=Selenomonas sp. TAMA-11512 TaxID=3095337 RepID=UPI0030868984|nr:class I SAM-dependent methyltransferase [Selenomonas sp. TAMA-11512]
MSNRFRQIERAYRLVGKLSNLYDGMMTYTTVSGKIASNLIWSLDDKKAKEYVRKALSGIPEGCAGTILEVPVGTGSLSLENYTRYPDAQVTCLDYSEEMLSAARLRAEALKLRHVSFLQGDVGALPFADNTFDCLLSINGLHAFPEKEKAFAEMARVLKPGGILCGCCYVKGENWKTDLVARTVFVQGGFFTQPFDTAESLRKRMEALYSEVSLETIEAECVFRCVK